MRVGETGGSTKVLISTTCRDSGILRGVSFSILDLPLLGAEFVSNWFHILTLLIDLSRPGKG